MGRSRMLLLSAVSVVALLCLPVLSSHAAEPKVLRIGSTVPMKSKEGIQIKRWLDMLAERQNKAGGLVVKGQQYNVQMIIYD